MRSGRSGRQIYVLVLEGARAFDFTCSEIFYCVRDTTRSAVPIGEDKKKGKSRTPETFGQKRGKIERGKREKEGMVKRARWSTEKAPKASINPLINELISESGTIQ